jgi:hypothetical protein
VDSDDPNIRGLDFDWLASDAGGFVALFSTAGGGYVPERILRNTDAQCSALDAILALPQTTAARFAPDLPEHLSNIWRLAAERGVFAFDSDFSGGDYRLVAAPETPVLATALPAVVAALVLDLRYPDIRFEVSNTITAGVLGHD